MQKEVKEALRIRFKWAVVEYAQVCRNVAEACREFEVPKAWPGKNLLREIIQEA